MNKNINNVNVIDCLQSHINVMANDKWKEDICKPKFIVSEFREESKIMLTIEHNGCCHTTTLFPNGDYGNNPIINIMEQLYNSTM